MPLPCLPETAAYNGLRFLMHSSGPCPTNLSESLASLPATVPYSVEYGQLTPVPESLNQRMLETREDGAHGFFYSQIFRAESIKASRIKLGPMWLGSCKRGSWFRFSLSSETEVIDASMASGTSAAATESQLPGINLSDPHLHLTPNEPLPLIWPLPGSPPSPKTVRSGVGAHRRRCRR